MRSRLPDEMKRSRRKSIGNSAQPLRPQRSIALDQTFDSARAFGRQCRMCGSLRRRFPYGSNSASQASALLPFAFSFRCLRRMPRDTRHVLQQSASINTLRQMTPVRSCNNIRVIHTIHRVCRPQICGCTFLEKAVTYDAQGPTNVNTAREYSFIVPEGG